VRNRRRNRGTLSMSDAGRGGTSGKGHGHGNGKNSWFSPIGRAGPGMDRAHIIIFFFFVFIISCDKRHSVVPGGSFLFRPAPARAFVGSRTKKKTGSRPVRKCRCRPEGRIKNIRSRWSPGKGARRCLADQQIEKKTKKKNGGAPIGQQGPGGHGLGDLGNFSHQAPLMDSTVVRQGRQRPE